MSDAVLVALIAATPATLSVIVSLFTAKKIHVHDRWERENAEKNGSLRVHV